MTKEGSLRSAGVTSIAVDKPTRARLKVLAGDMPVSHYVRELVSQAEKRHPGGGPQVPLPGQERLASSNTIASVKADTEELKRKVDSVALVVGFIQGFLGIEATKVENVPQGELNLTTG